MAEADTSGAIDSRGIPAVAVIHHEDDDATECTRRLSEQGYVTQSIIVIDEDDLTETANTPIAMAADVAVIVCGERLLALFESQPDDAGSVETTSEPFRTLHRRKLADAIRTAETAVLFNDRGDQLPSSLEHKCVLHTLGDVERWVLDQHARQYASGKATRFPVVASESETPLLGVRATARGLAEYIRDSPGASLAVYGPWGRGKTFLAKETEQALRDIAPGVDCVWFSAMYYPEPPGLWVYLYETFVMEAKSRGSFIERLKRLIRAGLLRSGALPILTALLLVIAFSLPSTTPFRIAELLYGAAGVAGLVVVVRLAWGLFKASVRVKHAYFRLVSHREELGLFDLVGGDLAHLVRAWTLRAQDRNPWKAMRAAGCGPVPLVGYFAALVLLSVATCPRIITYDIGVSTYFRASELGWIVFSVGVLLLGCVLPVFLMERPEKSRLLLFVDDLDRCEPQRAYEIVLNLCRIVEYASVQDELSVVFLCDEQHLREGVPEDAPHRVDDWLGKLIGAHYRLPPMRPKDVQEVWLAVIGELQSQAASRNDDASPSRKGREQQKSEWLTDSELTAMSLVEISLDDGLTAPREIRAAVNRFGLARRLLSARRAPYDATAVAQAVTTGPSTQAEPDDPTEQVAAEVCTARFLTHNQAREPDLPLEADAADRTPDAENAEG